MEQDTWQDLAERVGEFCKFDPLYNRLAEIFKAPELHRVYAAELRARTSNIANYGNEGGRIQDRIRLDLVTGFLVYYTMQTAKKSN